MKSSIIRPDILTNTGRYYNFLSGDNLITVKEIARALSRICRFGGHLKDDVEFYSVAQHSVFVSQIVPREDAFFGLFHDAAEAYIGDVTKPLKQLLPDFMGIEKHVEREVFQSLKLYHPMPKSIKLADRIMLATEQRDLMPPHDDVWALTEGIEPLPEKIEPLLPNAAFALFMHRFEHLIVGGL
ncbi:MAG: metal-dependent phosphohydrolase [Methylophilaceae bacterium]